MSVAAYRIVPYQQQWGLTHDGSTAGPYVSKEAALEAALGPMMNAIKQGLEVKLTIPGRRQGESALGTQIA